MVEDAVREMAVIDVELARLRPRARLGGVFDRQVAWLRIDELLERRFELAEGPDEEPDE